MNIVYIIPKDELHNHMKMFFLAFCLPTSLRFSAWAKWLSGRAACWRWGSRPWVLGRRPSPTGTQSRLSETWDVSGFPIQYISSHYFHLFCYILLGCELLDVFNRFWIWNAFGQVTRHCWQHRHAAPGKKLRWQEKLDSGCQNVDLRSTNRPTPWHIDQIECCLTSLIALKTGRLTSVSAGYHVLWVQADAVARTAKCCNFFCFALCC